MGGQELMGRRLTRLKTWMAAQSRRRLWAALGVMALLNLATGVYLLGTYPIIPFQPICDDDEGLRSLFDPLRSIDGELSTKFYSAIRDTFFDQGIDFLSEFPVVYVTFPDWFEEEILWNMTTKAVWRIIEEEKGITRSEDVDLPGFQFGLPNCEALRAIAIR